MMRDRPISMVVNSRHSIAAWASAMRGTLTFSDGAVVKAAISTSLSSAGKSVAQMFIWLAISSVTIFTTNSPVRLMLRAVSLGSYLGIERLVTPMPTIGGSVHRQLYALKGAAFRRPCSSMLVMRAMGRGATRPTRSLYAWFAGSASRSNFIRRFSRLTGDYYG